MEYNTAQAAATLAEISGGLAGFAFAALIFLIPIITTREDQLDATERQILSRLAAIMRLAFFGLVAAAILQSIRGGAAQTDLQTAALTLFVDHVMVGSILMLFAGLLLMASLFLIDDDQDAPRRRDPFAAFNLFDVAGLITIALMTVIVRGFWEMVPITDDIWTLVMVVASGAVYSIGATVLRGWFEAQRRLLYRTLILFVLVNCGLAAWVWGSDVVVIGDGAALLAGIASMMLLALIASWLRTVYVTSPLLRRPPSSNQSNQS